MIEDVRTYCTEKDIKGGNLEAFAESVSSKTQPSEFPKNITPEDLRKLTPEDLSRKLYGSVSSKTQPGDFSSSSKIPPREEQIDHSQRIVSKPRRWNVDKGFLNQTPSPYGKTRLTPLEVAVLIVNNDAYKDFDNFWQAYDAFRKNNPELVYVLASTDIIRLLDKKPPYELVIVGMAHGNIVRAVQFRKDHPEFTYE